MSLDFSFSGDFDFSESLIFFFLPTGLGVSDLWADNANSPEYRPFLVSEYFCRC